mgnify:FL=1
MNGQDFENLIVIKTPCPTPDCLWGRHYHHFVDDYYFCNCGWKLAGDAFVPESYNGDEHDSENHQVHPPKDDTLESV